MKKMKIEKQLIFADHVNQVLAVKASEELTYKHEEDGIRALGPLYIDGQYVGDDGVESFQETLEMDVFAPSQKLNGSDFYLEIADYQANVSEDGIQLLITMNIHGLLEDKRGQSKAIVAKELPPMPQVTPQPVVSAPVSKPSMKTMKQENNQPQSNVVPEGMEEAVERSAVDDFNDLFAETESTYTSYRMIVAKPEDSYGSIAQRYAVDEMALRNTNKNKDIMAKSLVILPFVQE